MHVRQDRKAPASECKCAEARYSIVGRLAPACLPAAQVHVFRRAARPLGEGLKQVVKQHSFKPARVPFLCL